MSTEKVKFGNSFVYGDPIALCRLQKYIYKFLSMKLHPEWFNEVLSDIYGNSLIPVPKSFLDEDIIIGNIERKDYVVNMFNSPQLPQVCDLWF
jgi:hypothetical protein